MIEPSPNCFSMAASVLRSSGLVWSMLVGRSDDLPGFLAALSLADFSDLVSGLAMRWFAALGVVGGVGRLLAAAVAGAGRLFVAVAATIGRTLYLIDLIERQGSFDPVTRRRGFAES